jgi:hypothetical protein
MILANFTPDDIEWTFGGLSGVIPGNGIKGSLVEVDDAKGNHLLNKFGPRGLIRMQYSKEPDYLSRRKAESVKVYGDFWLRQVQNFNELNDNRKNEGKPYIRPTKDLLEHAEQLGIELIGPWRAAVKEPDSGLVASLQKQIDELKKLILNPVPKATEDKPAKEPDTTDTKPEDLEVVMDEPLKKDKAEPKEDKVLELDDLLEGTNEIGQEALDDLVEEGIGDEEEIEDIEQAEELEEPVIEEAVVEEPLEGLPENDENPPLEPSIEDQPSVNWTDVMNAFMYKGKANL